MIEAVILFAALTGIFEWVLLVKLKPRTRIRVLRFPGSITFTFFALNLIIHWGTMTGSMTAVTAALASFIVTACARSYWGYATKANDGRVWYVPGMIKYTKEDLS